MEFSSVSRNQAELLHSSTSFSLFCITVRMNGNALDTANRTDSKYRLTLQMVNNALNMNGVSTHLGFVAKVCMKRKKYENLKDYAKAKLQIINNSLDLLETVAPFPSH